MATTTIKDMQMVSQLSFKKIKLCCWWSEDQDTLLSCFNQRYYIM